jgi:hypothetical protein
MDLSIRQAVMRTLATGALLIAVLPGAAVWMTRPQAPKSIVLKVQLTPVVDDDPRMVR